MKKWTKTGDGHGTLIYRKICGKSNLVIKSPDENTYSAFYVQRKETESLVFEGYMYHRAEQVEVGTYATPGKAKLALEEYSMRRGGL